MPVEKKQTPNSSKPAKRPSWRDKLNQPKTGWEKAKPIVLGLGIPVAIAIVLIVVAVIIFRPGPSIDMELYTEPKRDSSIPADSEAAQKQTIGIAAGNQSTAIQASGTSTMQTAPASSTRTTITPDSSVISAVDTTASRQNSEKRLAEEVEKMRNIYRDRRKSLMNEAVSFLRGTHSEKGIKAKAANYRELATKIREEISKFPKPASDAETKLWDAQKEELNKTADYCNTLADRISGTQGDGRKMKVAANQLETQGAP